MDGVDVGILRDKPEKWSRSVGGDKSTQPTVSSIIDGVTTYENPFTHTDIISAHCVLSSIAGAMFEIRFPFQTQAMEFFQQQREKLNQETLDLWNKIVQKYGHLLPQSG